MAVVYTLSTAEGSVYMMKIMLKKETGKRRVGANKALEEKVRIQELSLARLIERVDELSN